jgi:hypothetical protein
VILDQPAPVTSHGALPALGRVDTLPAKAPLTLVGYGIQGYLRGGGQPQEVITDIRTAAPSTLVKKQSALSDEFISMAPSNAHDDGAVCSGDSGGPDLVAGTNVMIAENSFVNGGACTSVSYAYRLDTPAAQQFIRGVAAAHGVPLS